MEALDALGSPIRRDILVALRDRPLAVGELAERFPVSRPAISRHLRLLVEAGLVRGPAEGERGRYAIRLEGFAGVRDFVDQFWDNALARLAALAEAERRGRPP